MEGDDVEVLGGFLEGLGYGAGDEGVGEAMEAVFTEFVVFCNFLVNGVGADVGGDGGVVGRVKEGDVGCFG